MDREIYKDEGWESLTLGWPRGHPWYGDAVGLHSVIKGKLPVEFGDGHTPTFNGCLQMCKLISKKQNIQSLRYYL